MRFFNFTPNKILKITLIKNMWKTILDICVIDTAANQANDYIYSVPSMVVLKFGKVMDLHRDKINGGKYEILKQNS